MAPGPLPFQGSRQDGVSVFTPQKHMQALVGQNCMLPCWLVKKSKAQMPSNIIIAGTWDWAVEVAIGAS